MGRRKIPADTELKILTRSKRRCALCFGLDGDYSEKQGQIAHVDRDSSNNNEDNLAFLCLRHHDQYDTRTSQSKRLAPGELRTHREKLYGFLDEQPALTGPHTRPKRRVRSRHRESPLRGDIFHARFHTAIKSVYPGWFVYVHRSSLGTRLAPVGFAVVLEVTNVDSIASKIHSYTLDIPVKGEWVRLPSLPGLDPWAFFWVDHGNLKTSRQIDFRTNSFDLQARDRSLNPGESIRGWMFFEWPPELRDVAPEFSRIRLQLENSTGQRVAISIETDIPKEPGTSALAGGELLFGPKVDVDLSQDPILPLMDLRRQLTEGSPK